ncbi:bifunctional DNA primase/polymerase [Streptomyces olivochromogenes]|uniref:bifunctional DNA primase/polymerase n=1 Tax=Streptomyces olivochromogenes TaxID=1963 RepID=UPI001F36E3BE|nr:bifunctional DNA primase/polymerase [Streptomyces olivochromogenes]MCF3134348.1 bifunctional DNA primase/polymerase [Streptomyces olivochromogenes]
MLSVEETIVGPETAQIPKQRGESLLETAVRYAEERHWDVFPGTWLEALDGVQYCCCGDTGCPAPGAHPRHADWAAQTTGSATVARRLWQTQPTSSILLPTGRTFDSLSVPESAGFLALARMERMELSPGPVTLSPDRRMHFFVLPGGSVKVPDLVRKLGWALGSLDLLALGEGGYVAAPPTRFGSSGAVQWACRPTPANRWLPDAEELISSLAYACGRDR